MVFCVVFVFFVLFLPFWASWAARYIRNPRFSNTGCTAVKSPPSGQKKNEW